MSEPHLNSYQETELDALPELAVPGTAVVACGPHADGVRTVALWHVSPAGTPTGAWLFPLHEAMTSEATARRLLVLVERRAITGVDPVAATELVRDVAKVADASTGEWWFPARLRPVEVFEQILDRRAVYEKAVKARKELSRSIKDLEWRRDFAAVPADFDGLRALVDIAPPVGSAVVSEALTVARVLQWLVRLWTETEQVKGRRKYVRDEHGEAEALPPGWLAIVRAAATNRIAL